MATELIEKGNKLQNRPDEPLEKSTAEEMRNYNAQLAAYNVENQTELIAFNTLIGDAYQSTLSNKEQFMQVFAQQLQQADESQRKYLQELLEECFNKQCFSPPPKPWKGSPTPQEAEAYITACKKKFQDLQEADNKYRKQMSQIATEGREAPLKQDAITNSVRKEFSLFASNLMENYLSTMENLPTDKVNPGLLSETLTKAKEVTNAFPIVDSEKGKMYSVLTVRKESIAKHFNTLNTTLEPILSNVRRQTILTNNIRELRNSIETSLKEMHNSRSDALKNLKYEKSFQRFIHLPNKISKARDQLSQPLNNIEDALKEIDKLFRLYDTSIDRAKQPKFNKETAERIIQLLDIIEEHKNEILAILKENGLSSLQLKSGITDITLENFLFQYVNRLSQRITPILTDGPKVPMDKDDAFTIINQKLIEIQNKKQGKESEKSEPLSFAKAFSKPREKNMEKTRLATLRNNKDYATHIEPILGRIGRLADISGNLSLSVNKSKRKEELSKFNEELTNLQAEYSKITDEDLRTLPTLIYKDKEVNIKEYVQLTIDDARLSLQAMVTDKVEFDTRFNKKILKGLNEFRRGKSLRT